MAVYVIIPTENAELLEQRVLAAFEPKDVYVLPNRQACFVKFDGNSHQLSEKLDLDGTNTEAKQPCPSVISMVMTYGGFAPTSIWEWLYMRNRD